MPPALPVLEAATVAVVLREAALLPPLEQGGSQKNCTSSPPSDRDLDGRPDGSDSQPDEPFHLPWSQAGSNRHRETPVTGTLTTTWDGRLAFGATKVGGAVRVYGPRVSASNGQDNK